jgi:hypothetical protein
VKIYGKSSSQSVKSPSKHNLGYLFWILLQVVLSRHIGMDFLKQILPFNPDLLFLTVVLRNQICTETETEGV